MTDADAPTEALSAESLSNAPLLIRSGSGEWSVPSTTAWSLEAQLRDIIAANPTILPGVADPASQAVTEFPLPGSGRVDVLCVSRDGTITLCEAKLERNPDIRRRVIGQIFAYAASLSDLGIEEVKRTWEARTGSGLTESLLGEDAELEEVSMFEGALARNLADGRFRLVLAVDRLTDELRGTISYIARHTTPDLDIVGLELAYASRGEVEILVPRTWGSELAASRAGRQRPARSWVDRGLDAIGPVADAAELNSPGAGRIVRELIDRLAPRLTGLYFGDADTTDCVAYSDGEVRSQPLRITPTQSVPGVRICFQWMHQLGDDVRDRLVSRLEQHSALAPLVADVRPARYRKRTLIPFAVLADPSAFEVVVSALDEALAVYGTSV